MKKALKGVMIFILCMAALLGLCLCGLEDSITRFSIKNLSDNQSKDYFTSDEYAFARIQDVVIIPIIKAINHDEYTVYICAYSKSGEEAVQIKNMTFKEKESVLLTRELGKEIEFKENADSIYEGDVDAGSFTKEQLGVESGKEYTLSIEAEVTKNGLHVSEVIAFEIVVTVYKSLVTPT